jgi:hypothetical protein
VLQNARMWQKKLWIELKQRHESMEITKQFHSEALVTDFTVSPVHELLTLGA